MSDKTRAWFKASGIRALKTMAQVICAMIPSTLIAINELNWTFILGTAATAGVLSICTSIAGLPEVEAKYGE